ncbi:hypothetical protein ACFWAR_21495 [Streptomyces sp. NPDC059917]|uniref:hypothetical protein n=1 Tax=Streptomyces sp. NPDC059917 TaxID=3347002 RepID=UPI0036523358
MHAVPAFAPLRVGRSGDRLRRAVRRRRRVVGAGLAVAAAALAAGAGAGASASRAAPPPQPPVASAAGRAVPVPLVSAPVRIADAATVGLLRVGDRVDVVAAERDGPPRVLAESARVAEVPPGEKGVGDAGALVVLSVPRDTARALVGAGTVARLAVTRCRLVHTPDQVA